MKDWFFKLIEWLFPPTKLHIRECVPWKEEDIRAVIEFCMQPFYWSVIESHGIIVTMSSKPGNREDLAEITDGYVITLDSDLTGIPLSRTALAHALEHIRQLMFGNPKWRAHSAEFLQTVDDNNRRLRERGL